MESPSHVSEPGQFPLRSRLQKIEDVIRDFEIPTVASRLESIRDLASGDGCVDVVVVGQYKAGKSSMLNALLGADLLPVDVLPATSVVTRILPGQRDEVVIRFLDGTTKSVTASELADFVTESANPDNVRNVERADVHVGGNQRLHGVRFVDTPGLGSIFAHNTDRAREWLPRVGVALVAVRVDQPFGEADMELIRELESHTPDVAIILTKADLVSGEQLEHVKRFTRQTLMARLGREYPLIPFSVRVGTAQSVAAVTRLLSDSAAGQANERSTRIAGHKLESLRHVCRVYLERELAAARAGEDAIATLASLVAGERRRFPAVRDELRRMADFHETGAVNGCAEHFRGAIRPAIDRVRSRLSAQIGGWDGNLADLTAQYARWMESAIGVELGALRDEGGRVAEEHVLAARDAFARSARSLADRLAEAVERALGRRFETVSLEIEPEPLESPSVRVAPAFDIPIDLLWRVIPMKHVRRRVEKHMVRKVAWEVEKNFARFGGLWGERAAQAIARMKSAADQAMEAELASVERLTARSPGRVDAVLAGLAALDDAASSPGA